MEIVLATTNPGKVRELRSILEPLLADSPHRWAMLSLEEASAALRVPLPPEPEESGYSFADNARIKAIAYARAFRRPCIADDSGLQVDALNGEPGVHSAYWAGRTGTRAERDARNNAKLLEAMRGVPANQRTARFVCVMSVAGVAGRVQHQVKGIFEGRICFEPHGTGGFGYDPLFRLPDRDCTSAELSPAEKNARSHRGAAARVLGAWIRDHGDALLQ